MCHMISTSDGVELLQSQKISIAIDEYVFAYLSNITEFTVNVRNCFVVLLIFIIFSAGFKINDHLILLPLLIQSRHMFNRITYITKELSNISSSYLISTYLIIQGIRLKILWCIRMILTFLIDCDAIYTL